MHIKTINNYIPKNEQESTDKRCNDKFFKKHTKNSLLRENKIAHFTNSAIITNKDKTKVLFVNHLIYKSGDGLVDIMMEIQTF